MQDLARRKFTREVGGRTLTIELSKLADQANASALVTYGGTTVLVTVVMGKGDRDIDYMPLTVDYEEKFYAAGKIIGSRFVRREGRPSDEAILSGRLVDRALRPLFDGRLRRDIQVTMTVLSYDEENDPDFVGLAGSSLALAVSDVPWGGPVAAVRIAKIGDRLVVNPTNTDLREGGEAVRFVSFIAGVEGKMNMIELEGIEASEEEILAGYAAALREIDGLVVFLRGIVEKEGRPKATVALLDYPEALKSAITDFLAPRLEAAIFVTDKAERETRLAELRAALAAELNSRGVEGDAAAIGALFEGAVDAAVHWSAIENSRRPDGRKIDEVRELYVETGLLERTHGSALFARGNTQALAAVTLAPPGAEQLIETMEQTGKRRFMLHYNFPKYSVGETGSFRGPGRRDIGHGALAEKALRPLIPTQEEFPYTIRVVSEILSSNGSSSMATVSACSMALMDAGVPMKKPAAGIAIGLMSDTSQYRVLTDIQGPEDHYGDMDCKVAGTRDGVNAVQMDVKVEGITLEIAREAMERAKAARLHILGQMETAIREPRAELSPYAPRVITLRIDPSRIGELIGPGGKIINGIVERTGILSIDVEQTGEVFIAARRPEAAELARREVESLFRDYMVGEIIEGPVVRILDFGAIIDLGGGRDGMIHVSELKEGFVKTVEEVVKLGDVVRAKIVRADPDGRIGLSLKQLKQ